MPARVDSDVRRIVVDHTERLDALEKQEKTDHARIEVLEKQASNMSNLPSTVAALGQKVESIKESMIREVDGLRQQQKAHKEETARTIEAGFEQMGKQIGGVVQTVEGMQLAKAKQSGWWEVLQVMGSVIVGLALIAEAVRSVVH